MEYKCNTRIIGVLMVIVTTAGKIGIQVVSFFLPSGGSDLPIVSIGIDNLSKSFRVLPVHLDEYLRLSLKYKNSTGFPGFKLIQSNTIKKVKLTI